MNQINNNMKRTLLELNEAVEHLAGQIDLLESETIPPELHEAYLDILNQYCETEAQLQDKLDNIAALIQDRKRWLEMRKAEAKRLQDLVKFDENTVAWLQDYLLKYLQSKDIKKIRTKRFNLTVANNGGKQPVYVDPTINPKDLPEEYRRVTYEVDKQAIREALEEGQELKFATWQERGQHLRIK
jgi:hypothetical protein